MGNIFHRQSIRDFSILVFILGVFTLIFRYTRLDISLENYFYSPDKGWMLQYKPVWDFIYRYGIFPGYLLAFGGLVMISVSYWNRKHIRFRKASLVLVFTIILGPGLLVNLVLKDHMGRPRPREITEFGGTETYLCVCDMAKTNDGKSFPCGHCSMGFYLAIPYLFYRNRKKFLARSILAGGLAYGILIGIARMMAGGHFASDVIWAGGLTWAIALAGFYLFRPDKPVDIPVLSGAEQKKKARRATLVIGILLPVITLGLMLATPYFSKKYLDVTRLQMKEAGCNVVDMDLKDAVVSIGPGTYYHLDYAVNAFGFPNSKIRAIWIPGDTSFYRIQYLGWFTEVKNSVSVKIPEKDTLIWRVSIGKGKVICTIPDSCRAKFQFFIKKGDLIIHPGKNTVFLVGNPLQIVNKKHLKALCFLKKPQKYPAAIIAFDVHAGSVIIE